MRQPFAPRVRLAAPQILLSSITSFPEIPADIDPANDSAAAAADAFMPIALAAAEDREDLSDAIAALHALARNLPDALDERIAHLGGSVGIDIGYRSSGAAIIGQHGRRVCVLDVGSSPLVVVDADWLLTSILFAVFLAGRPSGPPS